MYQALRKYKVENGLPLDGLDPVGEYLRKRELNHEKPK
jgi:hypothetical protein